MSGTGTNLSDIQSIRAAMEVALPTIAHGANERRPGYIYVPPSHAKALDPEATLVEGIRGSGKSFWWATLSSPKQRDAITKLFPNLRLPKDVSVKQGFGGEATVNNAPDQDTMAVLARNFNLGPRMIWKAVIATQVGFPYPFPAASTTWEDRVKWVAEHPEEYARLLAQADDDLIEKKQTTMILFDALDRLAEDWNGIRPLAKTLLQVALEMRSTRRIRLKVFARPDMLDDPSITGFADFSKLKGQQAQLLWRRVDLYALLFQCIGNSEDEDGANRFRSLSARVVRSEFCDGGWKRSD
jgi:hypothetical protein